MTTYKVGYLIGSLAKASINRKLATALVRLAPAELDMAEIPFKDLPLYSYDYDADFPPAAGAFKDAIASVDAVLFVTPEYNRSIPGGLKNAIDWASRPYGNNSFARKPSAVIGTSPGGGNMTLQEFGLYNWRGGGGSMWFAPVSQARGSETLRQVQMATAILNKHGLDYVGEFIVGGLRTCTTSSMCCSTGPTRRKCGPPTPVSASCWMSSARRGTAFTG